MSIPAIGIDLGTTNSCVAVRVDDKEEVFQNDLGNLITPSCVGFSKGQVLIGETAKRLMLEEPENTIYSIKRIIGRKFGDVMVQEDMKKWSFEVVSSSSRRPQIKVDCNGETYSPEEISGLVLHYMRRIACKRLDEDVCDAVVTVPAYFNHMQRTATKTAAELAGLNVLRIINEPTAAAIAFGLVKKYSENRNILVYDFGGGTLDVTVLSIKGSKFDVRASSGNSHLGGDDLTSRLVDHFIEHLKGHMGKDITNDKRAMSRLWEECEKAKIELSIRFEYTLFIDNIAGGVTLKKKINRSKFASLNKDLLDKTMHYVEDAIRESGMSKEDILLVVPVGGSSKIPYVLEKLKNFFGEDVVKDDKSPDQAIARGAAAYAAYLKGDSVREISEVDLSEVTPLSFGIRVITKKTSVIVRRNAKIPVTKSRIHYNSHDFQKIVNLPVCQGEEVWFKDNEYLGEFNLAITPKREGEVKIDVEFSLNLDGILHAKATEIGVERTKSTIIDLCGTLARLDITKLTEKLKNLIQESERNKALQEAKDDLESTLDEIKGRDDQDSQVIERCEEILKWLQQTEDATISDIEWKKEEIVQHVETGFNVPKVDVWISTTQFYEEKVGSPDVYFMNSNRMKGKVLIINNEFLDQKEERHGSQVDVRNLKDLWEQLGFQVETLTNVTGERMSSACNEFARNAVDINVLVLVIMSHGGKKDGEEFVIGEDNEEVLTEDIIFYFTSKNVPHLQGIPKIFMFQACRGDDIDFDAKELCTDAETFCSSGCPERSDMLIVYPSQAGYVAYRCRDTGSWLMNTVTTVFMRDAKHTHVLDMLTKVNRVISRKVKGGRRQMSIQHTSFTRQLYLFPGYPSQ